MNASDASESGRPIVVYAMARKVEEYPTDQRSVKTFLAIKRDTYTKIFNSGA
jgi:hypothetical protein